MKHLVVAISLLIILFSCTPNEPDNSETNGSGNSILGKWDHTPDSATANSLHSHEYLSFNKDSSVLFTVVLHDTIEYFDARFFLINDSLVKIYDQSYHGHHEDFLDSVLFFHVRTNFTQPQGYCPSH